MGANFLRTSLRFFSYNFLSLFLVALRLHLREGFSLVAGGGAPLQSRARPLIAGASPVAKHMGPRADAVVAHEASCCAACGILPGQGSNPCLL